MVIRFDVALRGVPFMPIPGLPLMLPLPVPTPGGENSGNAGSGCGCGGAGMGGADSYGAGGDNGYGSGWESDPFVMLAQMAEMAQRLMQLAQLAQMGGPGGFMGMLGQMMQQSPGRDLGFLGGNNFGSMQRSALSSGFNNSDLGGRRSGDFTGPGRLSGTDPGSMTPSSNNGAFPRYAPGSQEARDLFRQAARNAGLPESWADSPGLHNILRRESDGQVGRPNYTYGDRARDPSQWDNIHAELRAGRKTTRSSATGLGQLLLANVDRYYPSGRAGIGNPLEEATGMLRYIADRYGSPDNAWAQYGRRHEGY